jgi:hypothetical protein
MGNHLYSVRILHILGVVVNLHLAHVY